MVSRLATALALALAAGLALLATSVSALGTNYIHDGETTYCWHILQPTKNTKLNETNRVEGYFGKQDCPVIMTVALSSYTVAPFDVVNITWTVTADFSQRNLVNMTKVVYGPDASGNPAQIVHSNVHSCVFGTRCDPFNDGEQLVDKTTNKIANFSDNYVTFVDSLKFPKTGDYSLLAHIILPDTNASRRFDYAVYAELVVKDAPATLAPVASGTPAPTTDANTGNNGGGGLSSAAAIGIIVAGVVVVVALIAMVLVIRKRKHDAPSPSQDYFAPPAYDVSVQLLAGEGKKGGDAGARAGQSDITDTNTTMGFQSAWSGPAVGTRGSQNLDGTGASNASGSSFASFDRESQASGLNPVRATAVSAAAMYRDGSLASSSVASTATRPRRVDSDVEL